MQWVSVNWNNSVGSQLNGCLDEEKKNSKIALKIAKLM